jgi:hypothetical protein
MNRAALRERYLRDGIPTRLGGLAANLARVESFSDDDGHSEVVERLVEESKFMIEWTAPELALEQQVELIGLQRLLAMWHRTWAATWADPRERRSVAESAGQWSGQVLEMSGLLG